MYFHHLTFDVKLEFYLAVTTRPSLAQRSGELESRASRAPSSVLPVGFVKRSLCFVCVDQGILLIF
jgi:hypothetical protein